MSHEGAGNSSIEKVGYDVLLLLVIFAAFLRDISRTQRKNRIYELELQRPQKEASSLSTHDILLTSQYDTSQAIFRKSTYDGSGSNSGHCYGKHESYLNTTASR